jgi:Copper resistance protein ScsC N-terminal domain
MTMLRFPALALTACLALAAFVAVPARAQQGFTAEQRTAIEAVVKEMLLKNPELIQDALVELEKRQQQAQIDSQKQVLVSERATIFESRGRRKPARGCHHSRVFRLQLRLLQALADRPSGTHQARSQAEGRAQGFPGAGG